MEKALEKWRNIMEEQYRQAFAEVLYIIDTLNSNNKAKISKKFLDFMERNKSSNYIVNLPELPLENPSKLKKQTKTILALIYREYLCDDSKKVEFIKRDEEELKMIMEKYSVDIFSKGNANSNKDNSLSKKNQQISSKISELPIPVKKHSLWEKLKSFFGKLVKHRG